MQSVFALQGGRAIVRHLPDAQEELVPRVRWGHHDEMFTPAFWIAHAWMEEAAGPAPFALGNSLPEEIAACLLGGYGAPAEVGLAAFDRLRSELDRCQSEAAAFELLSEPFDIAGRRVRYRFAGQRARYLSACLSTIDRLDENALDDRALRDRLRELPGIGPKTASWIVRNRRASDQVAILDIHIVRACVGMGLFRTGVDPTRHYDELEALFLNFCRHGGARASVMDAVMWKIMRSIGAPLRSILLQRANLMSM